MVAFPKKVGNLNRCCLFLDIGSLIEFLDAESSAVVQERFITNRWLIWRSGRNFVYLYSVIVKTSISKVISESERDILFALFVGPTVRYLLDFFPVTCLLKTNSQILQSIFCSFHNPRCFMSFGLCWVNFFCWYELWNFLLDQSHFVKTSNFFVLGLSVMSASEQLVTCSNFDVLHILAIGNLLNASMDTKKQLFCHSV